MNFTAKKLFVAFCAAMAATYGVSTVAEQFTVEPTKAQVLQDKITERDEFLKKINVVPVDEMKGQKVLGAVANVIGKRTNTALNKRTTKNVLSLGAKDYELFKTEHDVNIKYNQIDSWAKFPDFKDRYSKWVQTAIALARVTTGWYGVSVAIETDPEENPNGEDLNKGWLQLLREYNEGAQWFDGSEGTAVADEIRIGEGGDFVNLDAAVFACLQMVNPIHRKRNDLVVFIGEDLLAYEQAKLYEAQGRTPSEKERIKNLLVNRTYGGLPSDTPTAFPPRGIFITSYDNLSIYYQGTSVRRTVKDNPEQDQVDDFNSLNEGYVIEDEEKAAGFEFANVKIKDGGTWV